LDTSSCGGVDGQRSTVQLAAGRPYKARTPALRVFTRSARISHQNYVAERKGFSGVQYRCRTAAMIYGYARLSTGG
jgi:hypothetical protein